MLNPYRLATSRDQKTLPQDKRNRWKKRYLNSAHLSQNLMPKALEILIIPIADEDR